MSCIRGSGVRGNICPIYEVPVYKTSGIGNKILAISYTGHALNTKWTVRYRRFQYTKCMVYETSFCLFRIADVYRLGKYPNALKSNCVISHNYIHLVTHLATVSHFGNSFGNGVEQTHQTQLGTQRSVWAKSAHFTRPLDINGAITFYIKNIWVEFF